MDSELQDFAQHYRDMLRHALYFVRSMDAEGSLSVGHLSTLNMLADGPLRVSAIARNAGIRVPSATEQVIKLETAGLVQRTADPADARVVLVRLTDQGRSRRAEANASRNATMAQALETLTSDERSAILKAIPAIAKLNAALAQQNH